MAWIELHQKLRRHPKLLHLAEELGVGDPDHVRAKLENIWFWALDYAEAGIIRIVPDGKQERAIVEAADNHGHPCHIPALTLGQFMAEAAGWQGDSRAMAAALLKTGWIDIRKAGNWGQEWQIHDWQEYAGRLIARRRADRERKSHKNSTGIPAVPYPTVPYPTVPNQPEEKSGADAPVALVGLADCKAVTQRLVDLWNAGKVEREWIRVTPQRIAKVKARLKEFKEDQLVEVVSKCVESDWHRGVNDRGWRASGPEWVLHTTERVEQWLQRKGPVDPLIEWARREDEKVRQKNAAQS